MALGVKWPGPPNQRRRCFLGIAPKAMLFANHIDSLAACGILMGDNWLGKRIVTVDLLGDDFLDAVKTGDKVKVHEDGTIEVG